MSEFFLELFSEEIPSNLQQNLREDLLKSFNDFFLEKSSNKILLNEINTIPGFTKKSMFPMLWKASGLNIEQLVAKLVEISLDF